MFSINLAFMKPELIMYLTPLLNSLFFFCFNFSFFPYLELEPRASHMLGECSTPGLYLHSFNGD